MSSADYRELRLRDGRTLAYAEYGRTVPCGTPGCWRGRGGYDLRTIALPSHVWHGEHDGNVPVMHGRYLAGAISNCRATIRTRRISRCR